MRSAARNNKRFDPGLGITILNRQSHSKRRFHKITITSKLEKLTFVHKCRATCLSRRGDGLSCPSSCQLSNTIQRSTTVQNRVSFRHGHGDTHEVRALLRLSVDGETVQVSTPPAGGLEKSHTAFGFRRCRHQVEAVFIPMTSPHNRHWDRDARRCFKGSHSPLTSLLPLLLPLPPLLLSLFPLLLPLLLPLWIVPLLSFPLPRDDSSLFRTASVAERPSGAGIAITGQKPRPRRT